MPYSHVSPHPRDHRSRMIRAGFLSVLLTLAGSGWVQAQERLYQLEMLVFVFEDQRERYHAAEGAAAPRMRGAVRIRPVTDSTAGGLPPYTLLQRSELQGLSRANQRLAAAPDTRPVAHLAWRQPMFSFHSNRRVRLESELHGDVSTSSAFTLEGTVALQRGRYINLQMDLLLREDSGLPDWEGEHGVAAPIEYRMTERRQIRIGELQYFDHGAFGVIARVDRYLRPDQTEDDDDEPLDAE